MVYLKLYISITTLMKCTSSKAKIDRLEFVKPATCFLHTIHTKNKGIECLKHTRGKLRLLLLIINENIPQIKKQYWR
jgi:hypothetical protein